MISVRQARVLPPSFFRFRLTADTLDLGYILPTAGRIRDFHPLEHALTGRTAKIPVFRSGNRDFSIFLTFSEGTSILSIKHQIYKDEEVSDQ